MAVIKPEQIFSYLVSNGISDAMAIGILVNIQAESNFSTTAVGDGGTSGGLFQHHNERWTALKAYATSTGRAWTDWTAQVDFALAEAANMSGWNPAATDPAAAASWWTTYFERPANTAQKAIERAGLVSQYAYLSDETFVTDYTPPMSTTTNTSTDAAIYPPGYPAGMSLFNIGGKQYLLGKVGSARIYFELDGPAPTNVAATYTATLADWQASVANGRWVNGGFGSELYSAAGQTWDAVVDRFLWEAGIKGTAAENDPTVMQVMAEKLGRPDMTDQELMGRLRGTEYWNSTTEAFRQWNDLSVTEQAQTIMDSAGWLAGQYFTYVGQDINLSQYDSNGDGVVSSLELQQGNPTIYKWALDIASGKATQLQVTNDFLKAEAAKDPNSPWSRTLKNELKEQGQEQVDIAGAAQEVQRLYRRYGIEISLAQAKIEGEKVAMNQLTFPDLEEKLKDMAQGLYPMKPRDLDVETYSMPYRRVFESMMEIPDPGMFDRGVQSAMNAGISLAEYKDMLRADDRWQTTDNARDEYVQTFSALGARMGF